jgi:mono/diheme cytochrome c family protein
MISKRKNPTNPLAAQSPKRRSLCVLLIAASMLVGCDGMWINTPVYFTPNFVEVASQEKQLLGASGKIVAVDRLETPAATITDIATVLEAMFGTPDNPAVMPETGLDIAKIRRAAGPVWSDADANTGGLFRQHCVHCHGVTGAGNGPTSRTLNPYPRDFRYGVFKFKSTDGPARPTDEDLHKILFNGIPGTAMPSFKLLRKDELDALVEYVKYLSIRGETEKALIFQTLDSGEPIDTSRDNLLGSEVLGGVVENWNDAKDAIVWPKTQQPEDITDEKLAESIDRGRKLFYTVKANCFSCHGYAARGDGVTNDYDYWNKMVQEEWTGIGALPKRTIKPRNLRDGIFRGGRTPLDVYRRIYAGINGTPMPAAKASLVQGDDDQEVWDLVNYVRNLPYELETSPREAEGHTRSRN